MGRLSLLLLLLPFFFFISPLSVFLFHTIPHAYAAMTSCYSRLSLILPYLPSELFGFPSCFLFSRLVFYFILFRLNAEYCALRTPVPALGFSCFFFPFVRLFEEEKRSVMTYLSCS
ncbi:hypothetical protein H113_03035 [Trichophyton rubrum MR1459]|uniref:Uncharacterized protein n=2 Tax=Trichophyton rubrum TaxID=5551 RepID=F2ST40_TRIRC|nr:uncharacterized protein TERG_08869 [Trichophyton rubrum CBS 118892]EZF24414.1 hypothetical protein H100_03026 [Trichophyton rubrum MR850]EZF64711.1 hypothetical protein H104_03014 [Trichophyton rubrum CBS 289.86]EZF86073.1 hypothetical protein H110_03027 [Trichophyton rubrum MR1448]EZF96805.1 hypothetical protein H113_03035 [Trichophyton rubrum MR1459]EZG18375.1 hypothetical protein H107_03121 [Trichophyton rubrum CBS 202.88]